MHIKSAKCLFVAGVSAALCNSAWALDPQSIKLFEGVMFTPSLKVAERYDDNFRAVQNGKQSSWITGITPTFVLDAENAKSDYILSYSAESNIFHSSPSADHTDHHLMADANYEFDAHNRLQLGAGYHRVEDTASQNVNKYSLENDKFSTANVGGLYSYGVPQSSLMQVDFFGNYEQLRYHNSGDLSSSLERNTTSLGSIFYYRVGPKTRVLFEARDTNYDYISNTALNSNDIGLLGGLVWDVSAKISGTFKFGAERKRFDDSSLSPRSGSLWEALVSWHPGIYSTFNLSTLRAIQENDDSNVTVAASSIETKRTRLEWKNQWLDRLTSEVSYSYIEKQYQDVSRSDQESNFGLGLTYEMRRWLDVGVGYQLLKNDSSLWGKSYERNIFSISFTASL
ncbi:outer membrane beta-barrel protein [Pseudomonas sp. MH9.2]|uniref:outer membrane beta-barrel protein n=1 Tax=unclassified Pseudomonas TaxID=196821 RepID=UPI002AC8FA62|nr:MULTISPECIES: outer membrane beta-barrel protein [unclassified Pseudomonas]MEB0028806.1 outer membrane beta-barrel protein [Pseudomonas sp. MH9.2]MEB0150086.1 outer membrane beta-barrel protein [Pseudomonas sp. CCC2.2]MEE3509540.1 outer membrane beta-barrel protein [Pseudomonas sp. 10C3]WPX68859.1 outer membrane beta-barrel protein [Pseudomonas sp. MH9.2]